MWNGIKYAAAVFALLLCIGAGAEAAEIGDVVGYVTGTDIVAYINNNPLPSYNINGLTAVMASDLESYGFEYNYNDYLRRVELTFVGDRITPLQFWRDSRTYGQPISQVLYTDIEVYADGVKIPSFNINGMTAVYLSDLNLYGEYSYDDSLRSAFLTVPSMDMAEYRVVEDRSTAIAEVRYEFSARGYHWNYSLKIPVALYDYYSGIDRNILGVNNYAAYAADPGDDIYISALADCFTDTARKYGLSQRECLEMVINFVQSFNYVDDIDAKNVLEYPSFPIETLFEKQGDCEDTAILLGSILKAMGRDAVLLAFVEPDGSGHMAVGVEDDGTMQGTYYIYGDKRYFYVETTSTGWHIGVVPEEEKGKSAIVITF